MRRLGFSPVCSLLEGSHDSEALFHGVRPTEFCSLSITECKGLERDPVQVIVPRSLPRKEGERTETPTTLSNRGEPGISEVGSVSETGVHYDRKTQTYTGVKGKNIPVVCTESRVEFGRTEEGFN